MSPPDQVVQQFTQAIGSGNANAITSLFASNLKLNIPGAQGAGPESVGGGGSVSPAGATTPGAANVKILDSFSAGDRVVTRFQYNVKGSDVEGGGSGSATLTALCVARLENGKVVEATIEQDTTPLLKLGGGGGGTSSSGGGAEQVAQQFKRALESGNVDGLSGLFASNLSHDLDRSGIETNLGDASKLADVARYAVNANVKFLDQVVNGDQIVTRFQYDVDGNNVPGAARGSRATVTAVCIARVENGKIAEANIEQDTAGIYLQLGLGIADSKTS